MASGSALFELKEHISINPQHYLTLRIKYLETANMFKNVTTFNNMFAYHYGGEEFDIAIPPDDYNILELIEHIQDNTPLSITYDERANKVNFHAPAFFRLKAISTCFDLFGLSHTDHEASYTSLLETYELEPEGFVNLSGLNHFYVSSNITTQNLGTDGQRSNILDVIPVGVPFGNMIIYNNSAGHYNMIYDKFINRFEIKFINRFDQALNMDNNHFLIILEVSTTSHKKIELEDLLLSSLEPKESIESPDQ